MASSFASAKLFGEKERESQSLIIQRFSSSGEGSKVIRHYHRKGRERLVFFFHFNLLRSLITIIFGWFSGQEKVSESVFSLGGL